MQDSYSTAGSREVGAQCARQHSRFAINCMYMLVGASDIRFCPWYSLLKQFGCDLEQLRRFRLVQTGSERFSRFREFTLVHSGS